MATDIGSNEEKTTGYSQGNLKGKGKEKELEMNPAKQQSHYERSNQGEESKDSHDGRVSGPDNSSSFSAQTTSGHGLQHTTSGMPKTPIAVSPANVKQSLVDTTPLASTPLVIKRKPSDTSSSPYSSSGDIPVPPPLNLRKTTFDAVTSLPSSGTGVLHSTAVLNSPSEEKPELSQPKPRTASAGDRGSGLFSRTDLSSGERSQHVGNVGPREVPDSSQIKDHPRGKESPESEESLFLGQSPQAPSPGTYFGLPKTILHEEKMKSSPDTASSRHSPDITRSKRLSDMEVLNQSPSPMLSISHDGSPARATGAGGIQKNYPPELPKFIDESINSELLWEGDGNPANSTIPGNNAHILGGSPPKIAEPSQAYIEARSLFEAHEANEKVTVRAYGSVELTGEAMQLQARIKALKKTEQQKV